MKSSDIDNLERRAEAIFMRVLDLQATDRPAVIRQACGDDAELLACVQSFVAALEQADGFLVEPTETVGEWVQVDLTTADVGEKAGDRIGPYKLLQQIGEGGFGIVFMAEQELPVRRMVALKVIKLGMDTREVVARFEAERQALAMMDHPNIARVFDAGATTIGRPYFVMELVRGSSITDYCDKHRLTTAQRVALLVLVCRAVQHAHSKGVIHRDLKPTNVLVTVSDDKPIPKVIDFGIAKATQSKLTDRTLFTAFRQLIGTPQYMSPEQADSDGVDVDTRTDIYSLGVLLYELLVGTTPHDARALRSAAVDAMRRMICEQDPAKPSTRLSALGETLTTVANNRGTDARRLGQQLHGELDWIAMRALEKERSRRYDTAAAMADDLGRYLAGEAVLAGPTSAVYRLRKLVRRHRVAVGVTAVLGVSLLLGIVGTTIGLVLETHQRRFAEQRKAEADQARADADQARAIAESEGDRAQAEVNFLTDVLDRAKPVYMPDKAVRDQIINRMIEPVIANLGERFTGHPRAEMEVRFEIGELYEALGRIDLAVPLLRTAFELSSAILGPDADETLNGEFEYAHALQIARKPIDAEPLARAALDGVQRAHGPDDERTARASLGYAQILVDLNRLPEAIPLARQAYDRDCRTLGHDSAFTLDAADMLADFLLRAGRNPEAEPIAADAYSRARQTTGDEGPITRSSAILDAQALLLLPRYADAEPMLAKVCEQNARILGDDHPYTLATGNLHASAYLLLGRNDQALALFRQTLDRCQRTLGEDHATTLAAARGCALALIKLRRYTEAEPLARQTADRSRRLLGDDRDATLQAVLTEALALHGLGRNSDAEPLAREALDRSRQSVGDAHPLTWAAMATDAQILHGLGRDTDAAPLAEQAWNRSRSMMGDSHPYTVQRREVYASVLRSLGRETQATTLPGAQPSTEASVPSLLPP
jgi:serine/threonine protein kinase/tetratricopeptide (TPR) repeat protein